MYLSMSWQSDRPVVAAVSPATKYDKIDDVWADRPDSTSLWLKLEHRADSLNLRLDKGQIDGLIRSLACLLPHATGEALDALAQLVRVEQCERDAKARLNIAPRVLETIGPDDDGLLVPERETCDPNAASEGPDVGIPADATAKAWRGDELGG